MTWYSQEGFGAVPIGSSTPPPSFQPVGSTCVRIRGRGWAWEKGRSGGSGLIPGPGVPDPQAAALVMTIRPQSASPQVSSTSRARAVRSGSRLPRRRGPTMLQRAAPLTSQGYQASPCLASLWPRRSGPRPRTSPGGCGSWSSAQRHLFARLGPSGCRVPQSPLRQAPHHTWAEHRRGALAPGPSAPASDVTLRRRM